jgi:hypothetical protein
MNTNVYAPPNRRPSAFSPATSRELRRKVPTDAPEIENPAGCRRLPGSFNVGKESR